MAKEAKEKEPTEEGPRAFSRFTELVADGAMHAELSTQLHALMGALARHADETSGTAKGLLTIKLAFAVDRGGVVDVAYDVVPKLPKTPRSKGVLYLTKGNNLTAASTKQGSPPSRREGVRHRGGSERWGTDRPGKERVTWKQYGKQRPRRLLVCPTAGASRLGARADAWRSRVGPR